MFSVLVLQGCGKDSYDKYDVRTVIGHKDICIVSQYTPNMSSFASLATQNHEKYANKHGYTYQVYNGRISGSQFLDPSRGNENHLRGGGLYWQKVTATKNLMFSPAGRSHGIRPRCHWIMWIDADILITDMNKSLESVIAESDRSSSSAETSLILPRDESAKAGGIVINNGAYLLKNNAWGRAFILAMENAYEQYKDDPTPEQDAFQDYVYQVLKTPNRQPLRVFREDQVLPEVVLVRQRAFDSFYRPGFSDPDVARWAPGDFAAHFSGISADVRVHEMKKVIRDLRL